MDAYLPGIQEVLASGRAPAEIIAEIERADETAAADEPGDGEEDDREEEDGDEKSAVSPDEPFATCDGCEQPIRYGNASVTIGRSIEQVGWNAERKEPEVTVIQSNTLLTLCAECGNRLDVDDLREGLELQLRALPERPRDRRAFRGAF